MAKDFLPVCRQDLIERNIDQVDFVFVSGDAYVDHPSFAAALLGRLLEANGYSVAILPQPDIKDVECFRQIKSMKERGLQLKAIKMILKDGKLDVLPEEPEMAIDIVDIPENAFNEVMEETESVESVSIEVVEDEQVEMNFDDLDSVTTFVQLEEDPDNHITLMDFEDEEPHGDFEIFTLFDDDIQ